MAPQPRPANGVKALSRLYDQFNRKAQTPRPVAYSRKGMLPEVVKDAVRKFITDNQNDQHFQDDIKDALDEIFDLPTPSPQSLDKAAQIAAQPLSEEQAYDILERFMWECVTQPPVVVVDTVEADQSPSPDAQHKQDPNLVVPKPAATISHSKDQKRQADPNARNNNPGIFSTYSATFAWNKVLEVFTEVTSENELGDTESIDVKLESTERKEANKEAVEANQATTNPRPEPKPQAKHQEEAKPKHTAEKFIEHVLKKDFDKTIINDTMNALNP